jgi:hypothetical protein
MCGVGLLPAVQRQIWKSALHMGEVPGYLDRGGELEPCEHGFATPGAHGEVAPPGDHRVPSSGQQDGPGVILYRHQTRVCCTTAEAFGHQHNGTVRQRVYPLDVYQGMVTSIE